MALKIHGADFERLRQALAAEPVAIWSRARREHYRRLYVTVGNRYYQRPYISTWRWDVFHRACQHDTTLLADLYTYLNDDNIYAALRRLLPE